MKREKPMAMRALSPARPFFLLTVRGRSGPCDPTVAASRCRGVEGYGLSARRDAVEEAERWGEDVQNAARRLFYCAARRDRSAFASVTEGTHTLPARLWLRAAAPLIVWLAGSVHAATDSAGRDALAALPSVLDTIDAWIEEGLLDGSELNAADFQIAPNVRPMLFFEDLAAFIEARPAGRFARRVVPEYPGHVRRVLPDEWLEPLRAASEGRS